METEAAIIAGTLQPVQVPGRSTRTARRSNARAATTLDDGQILGMNFYVKGIDDKIPGK